MAWWSLVILLSCLHETAVGLVVRGRRLAVKVHELLPLLQPKATLPRLSSLGFGVEHIYGRPVCTGDARFVSQMADAPPGFCSYTGADVKTRGMAHHFHPDWVFDNYAMERIMLGKWLVSHSTFSADAAHNVSGLSPIDAVIVPSVSLHYFVKFGFSWSSFYKQSLRVHQDYWSVLAKQFHRNGSTPLIVVHFPFAFHCSTSVLLLEALSQQPPDFVRQVVIATLEGNLFEADQHIFSSLPSSAEDILIKRRAGDVPGGPMLISLPYPTSILSPARFSEGSGVYSPDRLRPIALSMSSSHKAGSWIREDLFRRLGRASVVCKTGHDCSMLNTGSNWEIVVNSEFCLEPAGDTLTRAHFYIAVLSGCIPVIFDGGHEKFDASVPTRWAWRSTANVSMPPFINYNDFAVVISAADVHSKRLDVVDFLLKFPQNDPARFSSLRKGLDRVAPLMRYAPEVCTGQCTDAFAAFESVIRQAVGPKDSAF